MKQVTKGQTNKLTLTNYRSMSKGYDIVYNCHLHDLSYNI